MTNLELLDFSLNHPEDFADSHYHINHLVISNDPSSPNSLMKSHRELIDAITAYKVLGASQDYEARGRIINSIIQLLSSEPLLNHSEFVKYWEVNDMSFPIFNKLNLEDKRKFLDLIIQRYITERHNLYSNYGYSSATLQVIDDSFSHKRGGKLAMNKISKMLVDSGYQKYKGDDARELLNSEKSFILPDGNKQDKNVFLQVLHENQIPFAWAGNHQAKTPDVLYVKHGKVHIVEHKHKKEGGGGQNSQLVEIIELIKQNDPDVSYVSILDGVYFNNFISKPSEGKLGKQFQQILTALTENSNNYFVNTAGFIKLLE